ncbi:MAG TPA: hypothetical protein VEY11_04725 [Pyrinomonadaceae bacterium]|nr:hypothetical protein [Pyrinomonadaceae bacterium]
MQRISLQRAAISLALLVLGTCSLQSTHADTLNLPRAGKQIVNNKNIRILVSSANPAKGIVGSVEDKAAGIKINFESRKISGHLTAVISNKKGHALIEYTEAQQETEVDPHTNTTSLVWVPWLRVNGIEYKEMAGPVLEEMRLIAASPEGELIKRLALFLVLYAPGEDLEDERRGLEVPFQSMQTFYARSAITEYGGIELALGKRITPNVKARRHVSPEELEILLLPLNCVAPQCVIAETHDYQLSEKGGYVVKSLSNRLTLSHNFARPEMRKGGGHDDTPAASVKTMKIDTEIDKVMFRPASFKGLTAIKAAPPAVVRPWDDGSQVGDCYGRCGGGCGNWTHTWVGTPTIIDPGPSCVAQTYHPLMDRMCIESCQTIDRSYITEYGTAVHTASGNVTLGSKAHDSCCRSSWGGCWNPACIAIAPLAADCAVAGTLHTWSYVGYHESSYIVDNPNGNCWQQADECCRTYGY